MSYLHICGCDMETDNTYHMLVENVVESVKPRIDGGR